MKIRINQLIEHPVVFPSSAVDPIIALNEIAVKSSIHLSRHVNEEYQMTRDIWKLYEGAEVSMPDASAQTLIDLKYAEQIPD